MHHTAAKDDSRTSGASGRSSNGMVDGAGEEVEVLDRQDNEVESRAAWVVSALVVAVKMNRLKMETKSKSRRWQELQPLQTMKRRSN